MSATPDVAWQQLTLDCGLDAAEQVAALLDLAEPASVSFPEPPPGRQLLQALFPAGQTLDHLTTLLASVGDCHWQLEQVADEDWLAVSRASWSPQDLGHGVWIGPGWCEPPTEVRLYLRIDPGQAFGTGQHPTTRLCLGWLIDHADELPTSVIDYGCGTGVLAIAAARLGAGRIVATDIDPLSLTATGDNAMENGVPDQVILVSPAELTRQRAELVLANILLRPLLALAPRLADLVEPGGRIVLSGIMHDQVERCRDAYAGWFEFETPRLEGDWALLVGRRHHDAD
ncbi:ribosomal protein L11 methyltransferase [Methylohalomonas lacus]|uniref:Ribosomal protein L11 methyltransferase n=1 Tax=Methylohalomonas lacus TaxID=398773 RepID=A0AAE3HNU2_9GAMM|nr:50S ribosomal protein L11 methyltransferase [Methylohalomonas lacus]MCS3903988.1 ribosomal protein L11 methyltransferase [Methylohalomonas lacus]